MLKIPHLSIIDQDPGGIYLLGIWPFEKTLAVINDVSKWLSFWSSLDTNLRNIFESLFYKLMISKLELKLC